MGFTAKVRDAEISLTQETTSARKDDVGFVPLLHVAGEWRVAPRWHVSLDADGLAGGPGRAVDAALELGYDPGGPWMVQGGIARWKVVPTCLKSTASHGCTTQWRRWCGVGKSRNVDAGFRMSARGAWPERSWSEQGKH